MYAGGWITHAHLHRPQVRPVMYQQPTVVYSPPTVNPTATATPVPLVAKSVLTTPVKRKTGRVLVFPMPLVVLLIAATVLACNAWLFPKNQPVKTATVPVSAPAVTKPAVAAVKTVDPAELRCMAENIYFEAGGESLAGKMAVGLVVLNRMKSPNYPKTVCGVVHQKNGDTCMFSWLCEEPKEVKNSAGWQQSQAVAHKLLSRDVDDLTEGSTNFHGMSVNPNWKLKPTVRIDGHQFYR